MKFSVFWLATTFFDDPNWIIGFCYRDACNNLAFSSDGFRSLMFYLYTNRIEPPIQSADYALGKNCAKVKVT